MPFKQKKLKSFLHKNKVDIVGCLETKMQSHNADRVKQQVGEDWTIFTEYLTVANGRLWIMWKNNKVKVTILDTNTQLVHC